MARFCSPRPQISILFPGSSRATQQHRHNKTIKSADPDLRSQLGAQENSTATRALLSAARTSLAPCFALHIQQPHSALEEGEWRQPHSSNTVRASAGAAIRSPLYFTFHHKLDVL
ncbi:unnamed protein product [Tilletia controversa]|nr:unnamed protein product [Tilletia controversa]